MSGPEMLARNLGIEFPEITPGYLNLCIRSGNHLVGKRASAKNCGNACLPREGNFSDRQEMRW